MPSEQDLALEKMKSAVREALFNSQNPPLPNILDYIKSNPQDSSDIDMAQVEFNKAIAMLWHARHFMLLGCVKLSDSEETHMEPIHAFNSFSQRIEKISEDLKLVMTLKPEYFYL